MRNKSLKLKELQNKFKETKKLADDYDGIDKAIDNEGEEMIDVAELLVDNKLLLAKVDKILDEDGIVVSTDNIDDQDSMAGDSEIVSLTDSLIDGMFKKYSK